MAYITAAKWTNAVPQLRDYHAKKLAILERLFGVALKELEEGCWNDHDRDRHSVVQVALAATNKAVLHGPFCVYLEGRPERLEAMLRAKHGALVEAAQETLKETYRSLVVDAFELVHPGVGEMRIARRALFDAGLPIDEPDPTTSFDAPLSGMGPCP